MSFCPLEECQLYYEVSGKGQPLLLLHGLGGNTTVWSEQRQALEKHFRVIRVDLRGHGKSTLGQKEISMAQFTEDLVDLLLHLQIKKVHLLGHSLGGAIAYAFATMHPKMISSLIIVNSAPKIEPCSFWERFLFKSRIFIINTFGIKFLAKMLAHKLFPEDKSLQQRLVELSSSINEKAYITSLSALDGFDVTQELGNIEAPVLIVTSEFDYRIFLDQSFNCHLFNDLRLKVIRNSRHFVLWDSPTALNNIVLDFLTPQKRQV